MKSSREGEGGGVSSFLLADLASSIWRAFWINRFQMLRVLEEINLFTMAAFSVRSPFPRQKYTEHNA